MDCKPEIRIIIDDDSEDPMDIQATDTAKDESKNVANDAPKNEANDKPKAEIKEKIVFKQAQTKTATVIGQSARLEEVLDIIRTGGDGRDVICRVKYNCVAMDAWIPYEQLKQTDPQKLIKYFETRINWPHKRSNNPEMHLHAFT